MEYLNGFAGFGLVYNDLGELSTDAEQRLFALGMRYPGLDLQSPSNSSFVVQSGLKCVNWLTFVGDRLAAGAGLKLIEGTKGDLQIRRQKSVGSMIAVFESPGKYRDSGHLAARRLSDVASPSPVFGASGPVPAVFVPLLG